MCVACATKKRLKILLSNRFIFKWSRLGLNQGPPDYELGAGNDPVDSHYIEKVLEREEPEPSTETHAGIKFHNATIKKRSPTDFSRAAY